jgi:vacuolar-type H+-ATPase subunit F/Vma7
MSEKKENTQIAAIGPEYEMIGLKSIGIDVYSANRGADLAEILTEITGKSEYRLILINESIVEESWEQIEYLREEMDTVITILPSAEGAMLLTLKRMKYQMEQSIGVDLISE